jgi:hypothetical protein
MFNSQSLVFDAPIKKKNCDVNMLKHNMVFQSLQKWERNSQER